MLHVLVQRVQGYQVDPGDVEALVPVGLEPVDGRLGVEAALERQQVVRRWDVVHGAVEREECFVFDHLGTTRRRDLF